MFIRKLKLPSRYNPGTELSTESVLFYQDGGCIQLGREITIQPGVTKEKMISFNRDHVTEWLLFHYNNQTYVTTMKVFSMVMSNSGNQLVGCEKFMFTKAIENFLFDAKFCVNDGLESAQLFRLKNAICRMANEGEHVFEDEGEEFLYKYDKQGYLDIMVERLLLENNPYPMVPIVQDLICKKEVGSEILIDDPYWYMDNPVHAAVQDMTVPIMTYLASASPMEKSIVTQLSPYQYQPKIIKHLNTRPNEDVTNFYAYKCPFLKDEVSRSLRIDSSLYQAIDKIDRDVMDAFSLSFDSNSKSINLKYGINSYFSKMEILKNQCSLNIEEAVSDIVKWFNEPIARVDICKTIFEEIFIEITLPTGTSAKFYVDIPIFDLMAHNLV